MLRTKPLFIHFLVGCSSDSPPLRLFVLTLLIFLPGGGDTASPFALILHNCCRVCAAKQQPQSNVLFVTFASLKRPFSRFGWRKRFKACD